MRFLREIISNYSPTQYREGLIMYQGCKGMCVRSDVLVCGECFALFGSVGRVSSSKAGLGCSV